MRIKEFVSKWRGVTGERANYQKFWLALIRDVFNVDKPENFIDFEVPVKHGFIDAYLPDSNTLIEQKKASVDLDAEETFKQAKRYNEVLEYSRRARWIIACNFREFLIYDMETLEPPIKILLDELPEKFHLLDFLIDPTKNKLRLELELSLQAGEIVARIYDALLEQYVNPSSAESLESLNKLCVRLVFCLYAENSGLFGEQKLFREILNDEQNLRGGLIALFNKVKTFNDKLFSDEIEIPNFTAEIKNLLLEEASSGFNWSGISPTIFGAVFESTLNPETRRAGGMHYTSIENIHKVIEPLFLEDLHREFSQIKTRKKLLEFQNKLAAIKVFDPACGSGNFLTESYLSLRRLENEVLKKLLGSQIRLGELDNPIKVSIQNFYGLELNDFALAVAQTALWIAELQMMTETQEIIHRDLDFLPIKSHANIHKANALRVDWKEFAPEVDYVIGNPPFVGASMMTAEQKSDAVAIFGKIKLANSIDYVGAWYHKAAKFMAGTKIKAAFVSTNSITQGEQVTPLWRKILGEYDMQIIFGHRTFKWDSESNNKAQVNCVVVGMSDKSLNVTKKIYVGKIFTVAQNINPYLVDAPTVFIESRAKHFQPFVLRITQGNMPIDDGNFIFSEAAARAFMKKYPAQAHLIHRYLGAKDFLHGEPIRYCLWLVKVPPNEYADNREIMRRLEAIRIFRAASSSVATRKLAATPYKFFSTPQGKETCIAIPQVTSERRKYIPMDFIAPEIIVSNLISIVPAAQLYHFGVLTSSIHMAWVRAVCGRLGTGYRYSGSVVYNNFPWAEPSKEQRAFIEQSAQKILDTRKNYPEASLADLYNPLSMPADLQKAHRANDCAVAQAYGFEKILDNESKIVAELFKMYEALTKNEHKKFH